MGALGQLGVLSATKTEQAKLCKTGANPALLLMSGLVPKFPIASCNL